MNRLLRTIPLVAAAGIALSALGAWVYPHKSEIAIKMVELKRDVFDRADCPVQTSKTIVIFTFGQSNAGNSGEERYVGRANVFNFYNGRCYRAIDPVLGSN